MNHVTLYRKYRPKDFSEVAGENEIIRTIKNSLKENRMSHAYLFTGPRGVGKTTTARLIAKGLNCLTNGITDSPCNECDNCLSISKGSFVDLIEIDAASNRGIEEIRSLKEKINYQPVRGRKKIYIIDEVHMLTKEAFNALLKTLEEPPAHVLFILATTEPDKILDTIISRCQRYDFLPISIEDSVKRLKEISENEKLSIDQESLELIYEKSGGSMRDAISILEKVASTYFEEDIDLDKTEKALGVIPKNKIIEFFEIMKTNDVKEGVTFLDHLWEYGINVEEFFRDFAYYLKDIMIQGNQGISLTKCVETIEIIFEVINKFKYEEDKRLLGYIVLYKITEIKVEAVQTKTIYVEKKVEVPQTVIMESSVQEKPLEVSPVKELVDIQSVLGIWDTVLEEAYKIKAPLKAFMMYAKPKNIEGNILNVIFPDDFRYHKDMMEKSNYGGVIEEILKEKLKLNIKIKYSVTRETQIVNEGKHDEDFVDKIVNFFDGEII